VGGTIGTVFAGVFATVSSNPGLATSPLAALVGKGLWLEQVKAGLVVLVWSVVATIILAKVTSWITGGLRVDEEAEEAGLDINEHGEEGYFLD
jgi:Amt family ammonium transporter